MNMKNETVSGLLAIAKTGNEPEVRAYINTHWTEFPLDIQDALAVALMTDAVREHVSGLFSANEPAAA